MSRSRRAGGIAAAAAALLALGGATARAQDDQAPLRDVISIQERPGFVDAVKQIAEGHEKEGLAGLAQVLEKFPDDPDRYLLHYNAACAHARLRATDAAIAALDEAITRGYAVHPLQMANLVEDPDLASIRGDPRYSVLVTRAQVRLADLQEHFEQLVAPFTWLPPPPEATKQPSPLPLLIVLHPFATEREAYARERFLPFCQEHGFALLAPSGRQMIAPGRFAWATEPGDFLDQFRQDERRVWLAFEAIKKQASIDPQRVYVAGAGQGASLGFAVALRNPQWARGAVLFGGGYAPATLSDWVERSAGFGRRVALVHGESDPLYPIAALPPFVQALQGKGLAVELTRVEGGHEFAPAAIAAQLAARLAWIDGAPFEKPGSKRGAAPAAQDH